MRIVSRSTLRVFWERHPDAEQALKAWFAEAKRASWRSPQHIKARFATTSFVGNDRVVFNIKGNAYRLVVAVDYERLGLFIKFVGTHADYDAIDVATVEP